PAGAQPVVDADDDAPGPRDQFAGDPVGLRHVQVAADEAASVHPHQARCAARGIQRVDPYRHRPVRSRRLVHPGRDRRRNEPAVVLERLPAVGQGGVLEQLRDRGDALEQVELACHYGVDGHGGQSFLLSVPRKPAERWTIAPTSSAPFQKCVAPGTSSSSTVAPARVSASASRMLWAGGTRSSAAPCISRTGGAAALAWVTGLACAARSGAAPGGAPRNSASRDSGPGSGRPPACATSSSRPARSVTGNQATTPCTPEPGPSDPSASAPVSAAISARRPPAEARGRAPARPGAPPRRVAPGKHASRVHPVLGGVLPDPADRGADVVQG